MIGAPQDPRALAAKLGVDLDNLTKTKTKATTKTRTKAKAKAKTNGHAGGNGQACTNGHSTGVGTPFSWALYPTVAVAVLETVPQAGGGNDRSRHTFRIVEACHRSGLTMDHALWACYQRDDVAGRLAVRNDDDVKKCWDRVCDTSCAGEDHEFWSTTPILTHVLNFARSRGAAPYATLGTVLRRGIGCVDPNVVLPPILGGHMSLNLFTTSVGISGGGKDIADAAGQDAVHFRGRGNVGLPVIEAARLHPGSGEGLARALLGKRRGHLVLHDIAVLEALAGRKGGTLVPTLLNAYAGQSIGFTNNDKSTSTAIDAHQYRLCLGVGVQPDNARFYFDREKDGLPQRFLWLPTTDSLAPRQRPDPIEPLKVEIAPFPTDDRFVMGVPESVKDEMWEAQWRIKTEAGDVDPLSTHLKLTQLKAAAALAILHDRMEVTEQDWELAAHLIDVSTGVRDKLNAHAREKNRDANAAAAHALADRQEILEDRRERHFERVRNAILSKLQGGDATKAELRENCRSEIRYVFKEVFSEMLDQGEVVQREDGSNPVRYRLPDGTGRTRT